jgi:hypothetical protein
VSNVTTRSSVNHCQEFVKTGIDWRKTASLYHAGYVWPLTSSPEPENWMFRAAVWPHISIDLPYLHARGFRICFVLSIPWVELLWHREVTFLLVFISTELRISRFYCVGYDDWWINWQRFGKGPSWSYRSVVSMDRGNWRRTLSRYAGCYLNPALKLEQLIRWENWVILAFTRQRSWEKQIKPLVGNARQQT